MSIIPTTNVSGVEIDPTAILAYLKLNPRDPKSQALVLLCDRYGLDPLLKHMVLVDGNPYVTRDGYLAIAHNSGKFDGIEVVDTGETSTHWTAKVSVWRKDMSRPTTYSGRYPKDGSNKKYGPEMAIKTAEVAALRRAFNVGGVPALDERWDAQPDSTPGQTPEPAQPELGPAEPVAPDDAISGLVERLNALPGGTRARFRGVFGDVRHLPAAKLVAAEEFVTALEEPDPFDQPIETPTEPPPAPAKKGQRTVAQQLHIDAGRLLAGTDHNPEEILDLLIAARTMGRSTSANDLSEKQADGVYHDLGDVRDGRLDVTVLREKVAEVAAAKAAS